jgi:hypothetical protein
MSLTRTAALSLAAGLIPGPIAAAQCPEQWFPGGWRIGVAADVLVACVWDPDGAGPLPDVLVLGGDFHKAGGAPVQNIAAWDGAHWGQLGDGFDGTVSGLAVYQGDLFASVRAGNATLLFRFDGTTWVRVVERDGDILGVFGGELLVWSGNGWWAWNGSAWRQIATACAGLAGEYQGNLVDARLSFYSACVFRLTPAGWVDMSQGLVGVPQFGFTMALVENGQELYLGGTVAAESTYGVVRWDGSSWRGMGQGGVARALHVHNGQLAAYGPISTPSGPAQVAFWNGTDWTPAGIPDAASSGGGTETGALCTFRGDLIAAGMFHSIGGVAANSVARWDGAAWHALGEGVDLSSGGTVLALHASGTNLFVGGVFESAPGVRCSGIVQWDGGSWSAMAGGLTGGPYMYSSVEAMLPFNGEVIAGGRFTHAGGVLSPNIAAWDGASWHALGAGLVADSQNSAVWTLAEYQGTLYAGGRSLTAPARGLARWTGGAWQEVPTPFSDDVNALAVYQGDLYVAAGSAQIAGGGRGVARWNGAQWLPVGAPGEYIYPRHMAVWNGRLYIATNTLTFSEGVMSWDGQQWESLAGGVGGASYVDVLAPVGTELLVGGRFSSAGGTAVNNVALWNGSSWRPLGTGLTGSSYYPVRAASVYAGGIAVGGEFTKAGGELSPLLAIWGRGSSECAANCDCSVVPPVLNILDFNCFINRFTAGDAYANCDHSTQPPVLNVLDFNCFLNHFTAGCP